jgi:hypothetical protein
MIRERGKNRKKMRTVEEVKREYKINKKSTRKTKKGNREVGVKER